MKSKYRAKPTNGFPSKLEYALWLYLKRREELRQISDIKRQQSVVLMNCEACGTRVNWKVDFSFQENGELVFAEAKGAECASYKKRIKLWRKKPPYALEIYKGSHSDLRMVERIEKASAV